MLKNVLLINGEILVLVMIVILLVPLALEVNIPNVNLVRLNSISTSIHVFLLVLMEPL